MFGKLLGEVLSLPFKVAQVPTKIIRAVDEATLDTGVARDIDRAVDSTVGEAGRRVKELCEDMDD